MSVASNAPHALIGKRPQEDVAELFVDVRTPDVLIQRCTLSFAAHSGPIEQGQSFLGFLKERHRTRFSRWIKAVADDLDDGSRSCRLVMQFRRAGGPVEVKARCSMQMEPGSLHWASGVH